MSLEENLHRVQLLGRLERLVDLHCVLSVRQRLVRLAARQVPAGHSQPLVGRHPLVLGLQIQVQGLVRCAQRLLLRPTHAVRAAQRMQCLSLALLVADLLAQLLRLHCHDRRLLGVLLFVRRGQYADPSQHNQGDRLHLLVRGEHGASLGRRPHGLRETIRCALGASRLGQGEEHLGLAVPVARLAECRQLRLRQLSGLTVLLLRRQRLHDKAQRIGLASPLVRCLLRQRQRILALRVKLGLCVNDVLRLALVRGSHVVGVNGELHLQEVRADRQLLVPTCPPVPAGSSDSSDTREASRFA
mmetsp:Transcript_13025/g.33561  ORF Transcript_13025/g.33561 Transcript_13025/m.33561 type:complete len:301 (+) Transcript_13025:627-1529(+)